MYEAAEKSNEESIVGEAGENVERHMADNKWHEPVVCLVRERNDPRNYKHRPRHNVDYQWNLRDYYKL